MLGGAWAHQTKNKVVCRPAALYRELGWDSSRAVPEVEVIILHALFPSTKKQGTATQNYCVELPCRGAAQRRLCEAGKGAEVKLRLRFSCKPKRT